MVSLLMEHVKNTQTRPSRNIPLVALVGTAVLSPSNAMTLYSLYDGGEDPKLPDAFILELILLRDTKKPSYRQLASHFNLDKQEVEWFFKGREDSTAMRWAGGLSMDTDEDADDYEALCSEILNRWETCKELGISYVFWTHLLGYAMAALDSGEDSELLEDLGTSDRLATMSANWDRNRGIARRWLVRRETDLGEDDATDC